MDGEQVNNSQSRHRVSDLDLAVKWGISPDVNQATEGPRLTRSKRSTESERLEKPRVGNSAVGNQAAERVEKPPTSNGTGGNHAAKERLEKPRGGNITAGNQAAERLEKPRTSNGMMGNQAAIQSIVNRTVDDIIVFSAVGELPLWSLPGVNRDGLSFDSAPHIIKYELEEYMQLFQTQYDGDVESDEDSTDLDTILAPADWDNEWTVTTARKGSKVGGGSKLNVDKLAVQPKYFPEWFDPNDEEDITSNESILELPTFQPIDLSILESIIQDMSDEEEILELLSEYSLPINESSEDEQVQAAIMESWKDPKAIRLGTERRAGPSTVKLGAVIVEVGDDHENLAHTPDNPGAAAGSSSKGKGVDTGEKGPEYHKLHQSGRAKKQGKKSERTAKAKGNHLKPEHFKRDQSEIPEGGWFRATTVEPPSPPSSSSSSSSDSGDSSSDQSDDDSSSDSDGSSSSSTSSSARRRKRTPKAKRTEAKKEHRKMKKVLSSIKIKTPFIFDGKADLDVFDHWTYEVDTWADWNGVSDAMTVKIM
ncbi:hypothetical protein C8R46DRAFT_1071467, partial [Mycena filopes]